ncbi:MAG: YdcF family protein [Phenylobacterium sp.]
MSNASPQAYAEAEPGGPELIILLGCAVRADGRPSLALARRIRAGAQAAKAHPAATVFCSGGVGQFGPSEALVMAGELVRLGVDYRRLALDEASLDTLQTALAARDHMQLHGLRRCLVCTDSYHVPRSALLMRALGFKVSAWPAPARLAETGLWRFLWMRVRELPAIPYDLVLALLKR